MIETIIEITEPEKIDIECGVNNKIEYKTIFDYDNSHIIYKGLDLGTFKELYELKCSNIKKQISKLQSEIDLLSNEISREHNIIHSMRDRNNYMKETLKELQKSQKLFEQKNNVQSLDTTRTI